MVHLHAHDVVISWFISTLSIYRMRKPCNNNQNKNIKNINNKKNHIHINTSLYTYTGDKIHVVFGGTRVMQATLDADTYPKGVPRPPDNGCLGYVIRNGFNTSQGRLVRTIMFSQEQATASTRDAVRPPRGLFSFLYVCGDCGCVSM